MSFLNIFKYLEGKNVAIKFFEVQEIFNDYYFFMKQ